jgi:hypothetical protein
MMWNFMEVEILIRQVLERQKIFSLFQVLIYIIDYRYMWIVNLIDT